MAPGDVFYPCAAWETPEKRAGGLICSSKGPEISVFSTLLPSAEARCKSNTITHCTGGTARRTIVYRFRAFPLVKLTHRALPGVAPGARFDIFRDRRPSEKMGSVRPLESHLRCRLRFTGFLEVPGDPESSTVSSAVRWVGRTDSCAEVPS